MKNNDQPEYSGAPWNTDDLVFGKITCNQLARLATGYIGTLRMARVDFLAEGTIGIMKLMVHLLSIQVKLLESHNLSLEEKQAVENNCTIALQSICLAALFADTNNVNPGHLASIGMNTLEAVHQLTETVGPIGDDDQVVIHVRKKEGDDEFFEEGTQAIEMALSLQPIAGDVEELTQDNLGKEIQRVVKATNKPNQPPEAGLN